MCAPVLVIEGCSQLLQPFRTYNTMIIMNAAVITFLTLIIMNGIAVTVNYNYDEGHGNGYQLHMTYPYVGSVQSACDVSRTPVRVCPEFRFTLRNIGFFSFESYTFRGNNTNSFGFFQF